jgi:DNA-binding CsgD family transcriptional regulator
MEINVKMFSSVYMALTLGMGLVAVCLLFRVCRQRPNEARFRWLGRFFVSYSLINTILISDFLLRNIFTVRYYFIYSLFLWLLVLYAIGLTIFTYAGLVLELTGLILPKVVGNVWFVAVFLPLYLLIPAMKQAKVIADLNWVYQISLLELGMLLLVASMILVRYRRRIPEPWTKVAVFLVVLAGVGLPVAVLDNSLGGLAYFYDSLPNGFYGSTVLYGLVGLALVIQGTKIRFNRSQSVNEAEPGLMTLISPAVIAHYGISKREREIAEAILTGKTNHEIAAEKFIAVSTVKKHISNLFLKTKARNRIELTNILRGDR